MRQEIFIAQVTFLEKQILIRAQVFLRSIQYVADRDIFIWKLTNDGNFVWVKQMGVSELTKVLA